MAESVTPLAAMTEAFRKAMCGIVEEAQEPPKQSMRPEHKFAPE